MSKFFKVLYKIVSKIIPNKFKPFLKKFKKNLKNNEENIVPNRLDNLALNLLRNRHLNNRCFIIGNGPSLKISDLELLKNEFTFASNKIYLAFEQTTWRPTYYSVEDPLVAQNNKSQIIQLNQTLKIFPSHMYQYLGRSSNSIYARFVPAPTKIDPKASSEDRNFSLDLSECVHWGSTITYFLIQAAVHMGFKEIYLIGIDHSYVVPNMSSTGEIISDGESNHFHKNYRTPGEKWNDPRVDTLTRSYEYAREICDKNSIKIFNASRFTKLDVFEKVNLDEILRTK